MKKLVFGLLMLVGMLVSAQDVVRVAASHDNGAYCIYGPKAGGSGPGSCTNLMATQCTNASTVAVWSGGTTYTRGQCALYGSPNFLYLSLQTASGHQPDISSTYWLKANDAQTLKGKDMDTPDTAGQQLTYNGTILRLNQFPREFQQRWIALAPIMMPQVQACFGSHVEARTTKFAGQAALQDDPAAEAFCQQAKAAVEEHEWVSVQLGCCGGIITFSAKE